ncbi:protein YgfX [Sulfurirhabdus autotrophica]|uniref:Toxin CptA n=1 Tax=Sulfurirhabdus autotrophica TaxID=1706046 RepID=A0A4R3YGY4_9PROT|nr:protein YgfX [Sulfurirhabdus autotrophica]TCV90214.1 toxin CptA [Sulfurirhabdus autotrophica]
MLNINLKQSRILALMLLFMHSFCILLVWLMPLPFWVKLTGSLILIVSAAFYLQRDALLTFPQSIVALQVDSDCRSEIQSKQGDRITAELMGTSFVAPYLTVLNFKTAEKRFAQHVVIFPDAINREDFRQLRVLLRWKCNQFPPEKGS